MDLTKRFGTDPIAVEEGSWVIVPGGPPGEPVAQVKIARMPNKAYRKEFQRLSQHHRERGNNVEKSELAVDIVAQAMARTILLDWKNVELDGEPLGDYSYEKALKILSDERLVDFKEWVINEATRMQNFRIKALEEDSGKSPASLSGAQSGAPTEAISRP